MSEEDARGAVAVEADALSVLIVVGFAALMAYYVPAGTFATSGLAQLTFLALGGGVGFVALVQFAGVRVSYEAGIPPAMVAAVVAQVGLVLLFQAGAGVRLATSAEVSMAAAVAEEILFTGFLGTLVLVAAAWADRKAPGARGLVLVLGAAALAFLFMQMHRFVYSQALLLAYTFAARILMLGFFWRSRRLSVPLLLHLINNIGVYI